MTVSAHSDCIVVVNGPEDGTEFPVVRSPLTIGSDPSCCVHVRLDPEVREHHADLGVVADGYRIRAAGAASVYVNDRRSGTFRSCIARNGDLIRIGNTLLRIKCAPDGLAGRSRGVVTETDLARAFKSGFGGILHAVGAFLKTVLGVVVSRRGKMLPVLGLVILLMIVWPGFRHAVFSFFHRAYYRIAALLGW